MSLLTLIHLATSPILESVFLSGVCILYTFLWTIINSVRVAIKNNNDTYNTDTEGEDSDEKSVEDDECFTSVQDKICSEEAAISIH